MHLRLDSATKSSTPTSTTRQQVLVCRLAWNHLLPDGNKRAAWVALVMFIDLNDGIWNPDPPDTDDAEQAMLAIAAGEVDEAWTAEWLRERVRFENG
jgi:death-on-curing protein